MNHQPKLIWDQGSAYDLFVSLLILHRPDTFGLRPSWAAGVRSRLPNQHRAVLEGAQKFISIPLSWLYALPDPKDAATALSALEALPPQERLGHLMFGTKQDQKSLEYHQFLSSLDGKHRLTASIETQIKNHYTNSTKATKELRRALFNAWADRRSFGEKLLAALSDYIDNFFKEEEARIIPAQTQAIQQAQALVNEKDLLSVLEELSAGVRMDWARDASTLILAPSFWGAPFVFFDRLAEDTGIILFGARPKEMDLVPGELVPERLINALKALADPTRLRILRYLVEEPATPSELAKILRLRPPTVIHHLHGLRLAGLVHVIVSPQAERCYTIRMDGIDTTTQDLQQFLKVN